MKTLFISFDGPDGSGKTTAIGWVKEKLENEEIRVWAGKMFGQYSQRRAKEEKTPYKEWGRLRKQFYDSLRGHYDVVLLDRSFVSDISFLGFNLNAIDPEKIFKLNKDCFPDLCVILNPGLEICQERLAKKEEITSEKYLEDFISSMGEAVGFLKPRLGNRLAIFADNEEAVEWAYQMVFRLRTHFDLHLTNICPLKCPACCFGASQGAKVEQAINGRLFEIVDAGLSVGIDEFHLMGGEPLTLGKRLIELMLYIQDEGGKTHLLTSGYRIDAIAKEAILLADAVFVSLDGPRETHNKTRGLPIFDNTVKFIQLAADAGKKIRIGTVVSRLNIDAAPKVVDVLNEIEVVPSSLCWMNMSPTGGLFAIRHGSKILSSALDNYLSAEEWIRFVEGLARDEHIRSLPWTKVEPAFSNDPNLFGCELIQGKRRIMVMSDGSMYLCPMLTPLPAEANILAGDPADALIQLLSKNLNSTDFCGNGCHGGCPGYAKLFGNGVCDARCGKTESQIPEKLRLSMERLEQGYRPICPCRTVKIKDLAH